MSSPIPHSYTPRVSSLRSSPVLHIRLQNLHCLRHRHHWSRPRPQHVRSINHSTLFMFAPPEPYCSSHQLILLLYSKDIVSAGVSASVSVGTSSAESITTSVTCAEGCTCGLQAISTLYHVEGTQIRYPHNMLGDDSECVGDEKSAPYAADLPLLVKGGAKDNEAVVRYSACRVAHTFCKADPRLPLCPEP